MPSGASPLDFPASPYIAHTSTMRTIASALVLTLACCLTSMAAQALELARYPKVFSGPQGVELVLAPSADGKQALLRISGINHPIDQVVFLAQLQSQGRSREVYTLQLDGRSYALLHRQASAYSDAEHFVAYLPGQRDGVPLAFQADKSKDFKAGELLTRYEQQRKQGLQDKLARFDRPKRQESYRAELAQMDKEASAACGTTVQTSVEWAAINDETMQTLSISSFCGEVAAQMERLCQNTPAFKTTAASLGQVQCLFGPQLKLRVENQRIVFTTEKDAPNQGDFVHQFLRNQ